MGSLRTLYAITVVLAHSPWRDGVVFVGGKNAVQLFYMISGFLIYHILATNPTYQDTFKFYLNRALRLFPVYYVVALLTLIYHFMFNPRWLDLYHYIPKSAYSLLVLSNLFIFGQDWLMFLGIKNGHIVFTPYYQSDVVIFHGLLVPQAWTLGLELSFYAIAPFVLRNIRLTILLVILSLSIRAYTAVVGIHEVDPWHCRFFPSELSLFLLGAMSNHYLLPRWERFTSLSKFKSLPRLGTYFVLFISMIYFIIPVEDLIKTLLLFFMFLVLLPLTFLYQNQSKLDKEIGELSYPIYIVHLLIILIISQIIGQHLAGTVIVSLINVSASLTFAYFLNKHISARVEHVRAKIKGTKVPESNFSIGLSTSDRS